MSADLQFKQYIDRILRCREAEDAAKEDTKEVYAEMKADGYDKTAAGALVAELRKREKNPDQFSERSAILDLYRDAYERASHAHTHEDNLSYSQSGLSYAEEKGRDETGIPASAGERLIDAAREMRGMVTAGKLTDNQESQAKASEDNGATVPQDELSEAVDSVAGDASRPVSGRSETATSDDGRDGSERRALNSNSTAVPSAQSDSAGEAPSSSPASPATHSDDEPFEPVAFLRQSKPLRPDCLHPDNCAGYGAVTCHSCKVAARSREAVEA